MTRTLVRLATALTIAAAVRAPIGAQTTPANGAEVLRRMHDAYAGKWYKTLTFEQKTTAYRNGTPTVSTWYESLRHTDANGTQLRIDTGDPSAGNGMLYTPDSLWSMRAGKLAVTRGQGNEFLPMIEGVYVQPLDKTIKQVAQMGFDMSRVSRGNWSGRPVWIVGTSTAGDSVAPQFWIDVERNVIVRMILSTPTMPAMDIHLEGYVPAGKGWLATKVAMYSGGAPRQIEEYSKWQVDVPLAPGLFDPATWTTAPHWVSKPN